MDAPTRKRRGDSLDGPDLHTADLKDGPGFIPKEDESASEPQDQQHVMSHREYKAHDRKRLRLLRMERRVKRLRDLEQAKSTEVIETLNVVSHANTQTGRIDMKSLTGTNTRQGKI